MKALQLLDHVMLWVARAFNCLALLFSGAFFVSSFSLNIGQFYNSTWKDLGLVLAFSVAIFASLHLHHRVARICLGLIAGYFFIRIGMMAVTLAPGLHFLLSPSREISHVVLTAVSLLGFELCGFAAMLWTAFRPPQQSSSPNPVNLVNPV